MNSENVCEVYYKYPTQFILDNWPKLLPTWSVSPQRVVIILLKSQFALDIENEMIQKEKERLLDEFYKLSKVFIEQGIATEIISPPDGTPQYSMQGELTFDVVAVVHQLLGFDFSDTPKGCKVLKHPIWKEAVYPGLLLSQKKINSEQ